MFPPEVLAWLGGLFQFHTLTVKQQLLTLSEKYEVCDGNGFPRFWVVRPPRLLLNFVLSLAVTLANLVFVYLAYRLFVYGQRPLLAAAIFIGGGYICLFLRLLLAPFRDISVFADRTESFRLLYIAQENKLGLFLRFTVHDAAGEPVAVLRRHFLRSIFQRTWTAVTLDGRPIFRAAEDSIFLALLRRYIGTFYGLLRTNFDFYLPNGTRVGEYNRKLTLTDQYILDLSGDPHGYIDRRLALAAAILLDTGERR